MEATKFRVWNGQKMEMNIMAGFLGAFYVRGIDENDSACMSSFNTKYHDGTHLMQYSCINDKKKQDIYEGDLFKLGSEKQVLEVRFEHGCFMAFHKGKSVGLIGELQVCFIDVIGNIYENPELLQAE
ncbi:MAG: hypothetical protein FD170_3976 [Bacteroidetes bacterium]|nr:MAG: hypothetical protein FD170_3976 [Bacteroidota bacterium]